MRTALDSQWVGVEYAVPFDRRARWLRTASLELASSPGGVPFAWFYLWNPAGEGMTICTRQRCLSDDVDQRLSELAGAQGAIRACDHVLTVLGSDSTRAEFAETTAAFYVESNGMAIDHAVRAEWSRARLMSMALRLLVEHASGMPGGIARGFIAFRSHAEGALLRCSPQVSSAFSAEYALHKQALEKRVTRIISRAPTSGWAPFVQGWRPRLRAAFGSGRLAFAPALAAERRLPAVDSRLYSAMHGNAEFRMFMATDHGFLCERVLLNWLYWHLRRLGVRDVDRYFLCFSVAALVESMFGVDAGRLVESFVARGPDDGGQP